LIQFTKKKKKITKLQDYKMAINYTKWQ
jgi:hypothetical protein